MDKIATLTNARQVKDLHSSLKRLYPYVEEVATGGCGVSAFVKSYANRVLKTPHANNSVLTHSAFVWVKGKQLRGMGIDEFLITSRVPEYTGDFLSVRRVYLDTIECSPFRSSGLTKEFHHFVKERLMYKTPMRNITLVVLGDILEALMKMGKMLVGFKVDHGLHLIFKEKARSTRYLEVYIGGWLNEVLYPLEQFEDNRIIHVNVLRKRE
jgi:hypothetical protein